MSARVGVYICHCGSNIAGKVNVKAVSEYAKQLPDVVISREYQYMCSEPGQEFIVRDIRENQLDRIVVASCSPLMHEKTFRATLQTAGLNPFLLQMANIREQCSWVTEDGEAATLKAKALVSGAVGKVRVLAPLKQSYVTVSKSILVIGGGIAGIQAALQCAETGYKVYLVEREQSIGGHMAMLDKTFPTLDCSACILTPKMVSVSQHPNITLMAYSDVEKIGGYAGNISVTVRRKAAYVDHDKCNGCGLCQEKCPSKTDNKFEQGKSKRKSIYTLFPQAIPNKPVIDKSNCIYFLKGKCGVCQKLCTREAIDFTQEDKIEEITVGAIIVATGYEIFNGHKMTNYGYGSLPDVYSALEFERMVNSGGFTNGQIRTQNGKIPSRVGIIHCVGSRDERHLPYCSQICCMFAVKFAHLIRDHTNATVYNFFIDMRCVGKAYEEFYHRVLEEGVRFIRGKAAEVIESQDNTSKNGQYIVKVEDTLAGSVRDISLDMIILANGMEARNDSRDMARKIGIAVNEYGFFLETHPKLDPIGTQDPCVFIAGTCAGPKDIPHTVVQASAAAAGAISLLEKNTIALEPIAAFVNEERCTGCQFCVNVCPYQATKFDTERKTSMVDETLCRGCGTCVSTCPSGAMEGNHFTDKQILSEIKSLLVPV
ncbi:MAG: CoB--CoM heterodisulfide reductase iron-sulfur subunit A family protein [Bacteroidales bacterium]|nr:MAG: CoB--CoM heterodisulfide reductase iron-sulfur subunit A family protein [Bacteroidales bacterium]